MTLSVMISPLGAPAMDRAGGLRSLRISLAVVRCAGVSFRRYPCGAHFDALAWARLRVRSVESGLEIRECSACGRPISRTFACYPRKGETA